MLLFPAGRPLLAWMLLIHEKHTDFYLKGASDGLAKNGKR
jgi:hypothetical protein